MLIIQLQIQLDDRVKIEGVLTSFNNHNQFDSTCTIETLTTDAPVVDKTVTPWGPLHEVNKFVADGTWLWFLSFYYWCSYSPLQQVIIILHLLEHLNVISLCLSS